MAIDKALNPAPKGLTMQDLMADPDADAIMVEIELDEPEYLTEDEEDMSDFGENLAELLTEDELRVITSDLLADYDEDVRSREDWIKTYTDGLELLGMKIETRSEPWEGACGVHHPILSEALVKFQSETITETFPAKGPVLTKIIGEETAERKKIAKRVQEDMNYQLTETMTEYRAEHEKMLWGLGMSGNAFKKIYYDTHLERQVSLFVPAEDLVVPYGASKLETAERVTHVMRKTKNDVRRLQIAGFYRDIELGDPVNDIDDHEKKLMKSQGFSAENDNRYKLLEMHVNLDLPGFPDEDEDGDPTGLELPYIVTIEKGTGKVLAIRRNWVEDDAEKRKRNHFVHYTYVPGIGFYAYGLIHLIGAFAKSGTSLIRQLVDAGTLANLPGGFKTRSLRITGDETPIGPGEFRDVDIGSGTMKDNILPLPFKEPSSTLYQLFQTIIDEGRRFASAADMKVSDMSGQAPVGTTLAILERTLKIMSAVQARIHHAMKAELKLLKEIIRDHTDDDYSYDPVGDDRSVKAEDYDAVEVIPVSDPNASTMAQRVVQYQAVLQLAAQAPDLYDQPLLHREMLEVLGIKNADKLVPIEEEEIPRDPVTENMRILQNQPIKAFLNQDHESHLAVHMAAMQDPQIQEMVGQNPQGQTMMAAMNAHIAEHLAFEYRRRIEMEAGVPYPEPDVELREEMEIEISKLAARAAQQVLNKSKQEKQAQAAQQAQQDPMVQMQQKELQIKEMEVQIKKMEAEAKAAQAQANTQATQQKAQMDMQFRQQELDLRSKELELKAKSEMGDMAESADRLELERERLASQERQKGLEIGARIATTKEQLSAQQQREGLRMGIDVAKAEMQEVREQEKLRNEEEQSKTEQVVKKQEGQSDKKDD